MALSTIGSIANHLIENFPAVPAGVSGNMVEIVDLARMQVENFTGQTIGSNSISQVYQPAIVNFSKADVVDQTYMYAGVVASSGTSIDVINNSSINSVSLEGLSVNNGAGTTISAMQALGGLTRQSASEFRKFAEQSLKYIGRKVRFGKTIV